MYARRWHRIGARVRWWELIGIIIMGREVRWVLSRRNTVCAHFLNTFLNTHAVLVPWANNRYRIGGLVVSAVNGVQIVRIGFLFYFGFRFYWQWCNCSCGKRCSDCARNRMPRLVGAHASRGSTGFHIFWCLPHHSFRMVTFLSGTFLDWHLHRTRSISISLMKGRLNCKWIILIQKQMKCFIVARSHVTEDTQF